MLKLIKNGEVYTPQYIGKKDILIADKRVALIQDDISIDSRHVEIVNATGKLIVPGFIDGHVHLVGGGGEGGFHTRTPELLLSDCIEGGITTVLGMLGTDGQARTMTNLLAKAKGLNEEGITAYCVSGNYHLPVNTLTDSIESDIMFIQEVIGLGEIAISDHRSSQPTAQELLSVASKARVAGMLAGKSGIVILHVGDGKKGLSILEEAIAHSDLPIEQFLPTHINRSERLFQEGIEFAKKGGLIDFTTSFSPDEGLRSSRCLRKGLEAGVPIEQMTFSSDGQGSLPVFDDAGRVIGSGVGRVSSLYDEVRKAVQEEGLALEEALKVVTSNIANALKLIEKGSIQVGKDADLNILNKETLKIDSVLAMGKWLKKEE